LSRVPCPIEHCDHPARSGYMCGGCEAELARALHDVPEVLGDLDVTLSRQTSRMGRGGHGSAVPLAFDERASEVGYVLRSALAGWVRVLMESVVPLAGPACPQCEHASCGAIRYNRGPEDTCQSMAVWLSAGVSRLVRHPAAEEAHGEIVTAVRAAERVTDRPAERQFAGRCPGCGEPLYAKPGASAVQCRAEGCEAGSVEVAVQRDAMLGTIADQLMPATQVADVLTRLAAPLKAELVRQWGSRGRLIAHGRDLAGHPLYRVSDVRDLLVEKLAREAQSRAKRDARQAVKTAS
jgi:hypothetical protein